MSWQRKQHAPKSPTRLAITLSILALAISASSWWFNYVTSLPVISAKVQLVEPLAAGQPIHFKVMVDNTGKTVAKKLHPSLAFKFNRADIQFEPTYNPEDQAPPGWKPTVSDLGPGAHTELYSTNPLKLAHEHDVNAVLAGQWNLFLYGKIEYRDVLHMSHEAHFCGVYEQVAGADPLKLSYCTSYNETD